MIHTKRSTDLHSDQFSRSERLFVESGLWYFRTREGAPMGPFRYRNEAELMLGRFIEQIHQNAGSAQRPRRQQSGRTKRHFRTSGLL